MRRRALIAGVGPSLGTAIATSLADAGWALRLVGRNADAVGACEALLKESGADVEAVVADLSDPTALQDLGGGIDAVVWVAAAYAPFARIEQGSLEDFDAVHATGLRGPYLLARRMLPDMVAAGWGRFVVLGSVAGSRGGVGQAAYASAKAGLTGLVRTLAAEGGPHGVTANLVELGWVDTARTKGFDESVRARFLARTALGRAASPDEIAGVVRFLLSDAAAYVTGASIPVDGGFGVGL